MNRIYYSVSNGGDGSAYPNFFYDEICADIHQELQNENGDGWGESCTGYLEYTGDAVFRGVQTKEEYIKQLEEEKTWYDEADEETISLIDSKIQSLVESK